MKKLALFVLLLVSFITGMAQVGVVQDAKGETSLVIKDDIVAINAQDGSISFSGGFQLKRTDGCDKPRNWIGITGKANGKDAIASVVKQGDFKFDGEFGAYFFQTTINDECSTDTVKSAKIFQWYGALNMTITQFSLFDSTQVYLDQLSDRSKVGPKVNFGLNYYPGDLKIMGRKIGASILGASINFGSAGNLGDLDPYKITTVATYPGPGTQTRLVQSNEKTVYRYADYVDNLSYLNINLDLGIIVFERFPIIFQSRYSANTQRKPQWNPGIGIYLNKDGAPTEIVAGFQYQIIDFFDTREKGNSISDRGLLNVVAGYIIK